MADDDRTGEPERRPGADSAPEDLFPTGLDGPLTPVLMRIDVVVAFAIAVAAGVIAAIMPDLVVSGGIAFARNFATLPAGLIPRLVFGMLAVVAAIACYGAFARLRTEPAATDAEEAIRYRRMAIVGIMVVAYAMSVTLLGFVLATMIVTVAISLYLGLRNPLAFVPGVIVLPIAVRFIAERLLLISLPRSHIESVGLIEDAVMRFLAQTLLG